MGNRAKSLGACTLERFGGKEVRKRFDIIEIFLQNYKVRVTHQAYSKISLRFKEWGAPLP
jgi:hypothetical protein